MANAGDSIWVQMQMQMAMATKFNSLAPGRCGSNFMCDLQTLIMD